MHYIEHMEALCKAFKVIKGKKAVNLNLGCMFCRQELGQSIHAVELLNPTCPDHGNYSGLEGQERQRGLIQLRKIARKD